MTSIFTVSVEEVQGILLAAFEANGYKPTAIQFMKDGQPVLFDAAHVTADSVTLKVRCTPEDGDGLSPLERKYRDFLNRQKMLSEQIDQIDEIVAST